MILDLSEFSYYKGESENPYCRRDENSLNFSNPKALFWHYENHYYFSEDSQYQDLKSFIKNLIDNKLSEYHRSTDELRHMYFINSITYKMDIKNYWDNAVSYTEYLRDAGERLGNPKTTHEAEYAEYYRLGIQRMNRMWEKYIPNSDQVKKLANKNFNGKILIISEPWCGDASQVLPVVVKFFEQFEVRITYRDQDPSLIDSYLTNGGKSIPIVIFMDENFNELAHWGPRPQHGRELLEKHKADPELFPKEKFYVELQTYYAKNRGFDTIEELLELL